MKIREIIERIRSAYSKGVSSDDSRLTKRLIYNKLLTTRALLLSREVNKKRKLSSWNYITLPCVEIIEVPNNESCPCIPEIGCKVYRSRYKLPKPITSLTNHMIRGVVNLDRTVKYAEVSVNQNIYSRGGKYTKNTERFFINNGYIYIEARNPPLVVTIDILPEDIMEGYSFKNYCESSIIDCSDKILDRDFPIDGYLLEPLIQLTIDEIVSGFSRSLQDMNNNSQDNSVSNYRPQEQREDEQQ